MSISSKNNVNMSDDCSLTLDSPNAKTMDYEKNDLRNENKNKRGPLEPIRKVKSIIEHNSKNSKTNSAEYKAFSLKEARKKLLEKKEKKLNLKEKRLKKMEVDFINKTKNNSIKSGAIELLDIEERVKILNDEFDKYKEKTKNEIIRLLKENSKLEKELAKQMLNFNNNEIGSICQTRNGHILEEKFVFGDKMRRLKLQRKSSDKDLKKYAEIKKKLLQKKKNSKKNDCGEFDEYIQSEIIIKTIISRLKKEITCVENKEKDLKKSAKEHIVVSKKLHDEENSNFSKFPILKKRYILLRLSGKGGFSEVWKAYDLKENQTVACKIHQLNSQWTDDRKRSYIKHATREYEIHQSLTHRTIVPLYDVFGIDLNSFCTVLKYCNGSDLEELLKKNGYLSEKESKTIILQIFQGLNYLAEKTGVIHYDLKPGNILFHNGAVQITDFGLSKRIEKNTSVAELTSQGAGTYWYLPPETFESTLEGPPIISSKVDVWSAGVILYQMLFGVRPFGHNLSQESIIQRGVLHKSNLKPVSFPNSPRISDEAKNFILTCLTVKQNDRPDAHSILKHSFFECFKRKK